MAGVDFGQNLLTAYGLGFYGTNWWTAYTGYFDHYSFGYPLDKNAAYLPDYHKPQLWV
jgi:hypothetical protein